MNAATDTMAVNAAEKVDRDIPNLKTKKKKNNITRLVLVGGMLFSLIAVATGCAMFMKQLQTRKQEQAVEKAKERPKEAAPESKDFESAKRRIKQEEASRLPPPASVATDPMGAMTVGGATTTTGSTIQTTVGGTSTTSAAAVTRAGAAGPPPVPTAAQRRMSGDVLVNIGIEGGAAAPSAAGMTVPGFVGGRDTGTPPKNAFDEKLKPSQLVAGVAAQRPDLSMLLRRGTSIPCGQKTKIVTNRPGMVSCIVSKDVYSANGDVLLIDRGSEAFGEQRTALMQGDTTIEVLWTRIDTPKGVAIDINSLGTDALGASGHPAEVDNHVMQRFGGAVMLSLISDIGQALANKAGESEGTLKLTTTSTAGQDLATKTLENTINIPPTGYSLQGAAINIFVARDMDFRSVYELARY